MSNEKNTLLRTVAKAGGAILSQTIGVLLASATLIALGKEEQKKQQEIRDKADEQAIERQRCERYFTINSTHAAYSECMFLLSQFKAKNGDKYGDEFAKKMSGDATKRAGVKEENRCRSVTKDYWRMVHSFSAAYGLGEDEAEFRERHRRFKELVQPLRLPNYADVEDDVFDFAKFVRRGSV